MTVDSLLSELNEHQRMAASLQRQHALVLAGAGCGKTKTIIARAAFLISTGTPSHRIKILTFTRRAASEIVERVGMHLGDRAKELNASTFHTWCISLIRRAPSAFGYKDYSVIDRDDQMQLFKVLRGKKSSPPLPSAKQLCDLYSFARNTGQTLYATILKDLPDSYGQKEKIAQVMLAYEARKKDRRYLDYDDILDVVAQRLSTSPETCSWIANQYDHILVDEMQDTNPLQWKLINPLRNQVTLFCVGDDAQSIYGFRGADFRNVHSFSERVEDSVTLKLEKNYRSTQEILDASNWLLSESPLNYEKDLVAARGSGMCPQLHTFVNEWEEGRWIAEDLIERRNAGANWQEHMILVRSSFTGRVVESSFLAKEIPYRFIGGTKLLESAHVRDVLAVLRLVANPQDEIGWMRFLTLWNGVGEVTANRVIERILTEQTLDGCIQAMKDEPKIPVVALAAVQIVKELQTEVSKALASVVRTMEEVLSAKYQKQGWDKRRKDFRLVEKLAEKHTSILAFIEEYLLDPVHGTQVDRLETEDIVTIITIHSAKGTESEVCYVVNVSPGAYPSQYALGDSDEVEEERRVLYVALTRAKDELIVTRQGYSLWAEDLNSQRSADGTDPVLYFFDTLPDGIFEEHIHQKEGWQTTSNAPQIKQSNTVGITIGEESPTEVLPDFGLSELKITTLHEAATFGSPAATRYFLENGVDPNVPTVSSRNDRWVPLHHAAWGASEGTFTWPPEPNGKIACKHEVAEILIQHGANIDQKNSKGQTPLMMATDYCTPHMVLLLINAGADVFASDVNGKSVLEYAQQAQRNEAKKEICVQIIKKSMTLSGRT